MMEKLRHWFCPARRRAVTYPISHFRDYTLEAPSLFTANVQLLVLSDVSEFQNTLNSG